MPHLVLSLLGGIQINYRFADYIQLRTNKARALLAYLVVERDNPHRREALATMLWPDRPARAARTSLRQELYSLRKVLSDRDSENPFLLYSNQEIQFNLESDHWLDVADFLSLINTHRSHHPYNNSVCEDCLKKLEAAVELYKGDFMSGFSIPNCLSYEWWQLNRQEIYHQAAIYALTKLVAYYESQHNYFMMSSYAQKKVELEPWRESAHRQRMRALALSGQRGQALQQYETCRNILIQELGVEPEAETTRLYNQIRDVGLLPEFETVSRLSEQTSYVANEQARQCFTPSTTVKRVSEKTQHEQSLPGCQASRTSSAKNHISSKPGIIMGVQFLMPGGSPTSEISSGQPLWIEIRYSTRQPVLDATFGLSIVSQDGQVCFESSTEDAINSPLNLNGAGKVRLIIKRLELMEGQYDIDIGLFQAKMLSTYDYVRYPQKLSVLPPLQSRAVLHPPHWWEYINTCSVQSETNNEPDSDRKPTNFVQS